MVERCKKKYPWSSDPHHWKVYQYTRDGYMARQCNSCGLMQTNNAGNRVDRGFYDATKEDFDDMCNEIKNRIMEQETEHKSCIEYAKKVEMDRLEIHRTRTDLEGSP